MMFSTQLDPSRDTLDLLLRERELALHELDKESTKDKQVVGPTISYEEALERELEYRQRIKKTMPLPLSLSGQLTSPFDELSQRPSHVGTKRKAVSPDLQELTPQAGQRLVPKPPQERLALPQHLRPWQPSYRRLQDQQCLVQQLQHVKSAPQQSSNRRLPQQASLRPSDIGKPSGQALQALQQRSETSQSSEQAFCQQSNSRQPLAQDLPQQMSYRQLSVQGLTYKQPFTKHRQDQQPLRHPQGQQRSQPSHSRHLASKQASSFSCSLCKVECMNPYNYKQHLQGKQHKERVGKHDALQQVMTNSGLNDIKLLWCHECNVPCMNEISLAQHRAGKKHAACLQKFQVKIDDGSDGGSSGAAAGGARGCT